MKRPFEIIEVKPRIFLFEFKDRYDMCMYFLRYQEYYESPNPKFRGQSFDIFDFMKWYTKKFGKGSFTYPNDWNGFNIPGDTIKKVWDLGILSKTIYDYEMLMAWRECNTTANGEKFYIIGVVKGRRTTLSHEIAHGLFTLYPEYKKEMTKLVKALDPKIKNTLFKGLKKLGYTSQVYIDESQAYMSTGLREVFGPLDQWKEERKPFQDFFKKFSKEVK